MYFIRAVATALTLTAVNLIAPVAHAQTFSNSLSISIPSFGIATPYPSPITVAGGPTSIGLMTVTLTNFSHTYPRDVAVMLVGPTGASTILYGQAGSGLNAVNATLVFRDGAPALVGEAIVSGVFSPTIQFGATFSSPAPATPTTASLGNFTGSNANGQWHLYVQDFFGGDSGSIADGWSISFAPAAVAQGSTFTYQGKLDNGVTAVNGAADFRFSLWSSAADTSPAGQFGAAITRSAVPVTDGLFTASLDFGFGVIDNNLLFLQIEVRSPAGSGSFTAVTPRQPLTAALNAQFARNAANAATATTATQLAPGRARIRGDAGASNNSPGIWFTSPIAAPIDRAFVGQLDDSNVGFFNGNWSFLVNANGNTALGDPSGTAPPQRLTVNGSIQLNTGTAVAPNRLAFGLVGNLGSTAESNDPVFFQRVNVSANSTDLRLYVGDDPTVAPGAGGDAFSIWTTNNSPTSGFERFRFSSDGNAFKPGGGTWAALSDASTKTDLLPMTGTLDKLMSLHGYSFNYKPEFIEQGRALPGTQIGLVAQEVQAVFPDWVGTSADGKLFVSERATTALMIEALRDLRAEKDKQLEAVRAENAATRAQNAMLRERLDRLEKILIGRPDGN